MSNTHHSLSLKVAGFVLIQNGIFAALLFYSAKDATPLQTSVIIGVLFLSALVTITLAGRTLGALKTLTGDLSGLVDGNSPIASEHLQRRDEIGEIARELERLSHENLARLVEDDQERDKRNQQTAERDDQHSRELIAANRRVSALKEVVDAVDHAMRRFAAGDLRSRLDMSFPEEFEGLRADFNHAMTSLQDTLDRIENGTHLLHSTCADLKNDSASAMHGSLRQSSILAKTVADIGSLAETLRMRKMQAEHTANIAYNARIDIRRPKEVMNAATEAVARVQDASLRIEPVAELMRKIAFETNILAMNAGIEAAHDESRLADGATDMIVASFRALAEQTADVAREISLLSRQSAEAAEHGSRSIDKAEAELDAMVIYADALKEHLDTIAASSSEEIEKVAAVRLSILSLAKNGRDQSIALDALAVRADRMMREIGAIDHHAGRFTPVTVLTQGSITMTRPKRGSHLRLVK